MLGVYCMEKNNLNPYLIAAVFGAAIPNIVSVVTALTEPVFRNNYVSWGFLIVLCLAWVYGLLKAEHQIIRPEKPILWVAIVVIVAIPTMIQLYMTTEWYIANFYDTVNHWDRGILSGIQWLYYFCTICAAQILWLLLRIISGIVGGGKRRNTSINTETV